MAVSHKGAISFGLVHIPVSLYTATQDNDIRFNQLCKDDHSRIRYKKVCASCGKEVSSADIVKGFEYDDGKYVVMTDEDFEAIKTEKDRTIQILQFTDLDEIRPIYYDKTYHVIPDGGGDKAFALLREAMLQERKVAIAKTVMGQKETMLAILATRDGMLIETLFFYDEIKGIPKEYARPAVKEEELAVAKTLIASMEKPFEPSSFKDEYQERLRDAIERKIAGQEIVAEGRDEIDDVVDLMEALKKSLEEKQKTEPKKKPAVRRKKETAKS